MSSPSASSSEHSAMPMPGVRRSPSPLQPQYYDYSYDLAAHGGYAYPPPPQSRYAHYAPYPPYTSGPQTFVIPYGGYPAYPSAVHTAATAAAAVQSGAPSHIEHTDDASIKPSDIIHRRCFNCCTTETATWRRSKISTGKLLCNKCGIFERTHSRSRPDQLSYKHSRISKQSPSSAPPQPCQPNSIRGHSAFSAPQHNYHFAAHLPFLLPGPPPSPPKREFALHAGTTDTASTHPTHVAGDALPSRDKLVNASHNFDAGNQMRNSRGRKRSPRSEIKGITASQ